jgi:hypothetical protein
MAAAIMVGIPYRFLGAESTPVNWRESLFETLIILPLVLVIIYYTRKIFSRMKYLEGLLPVCTSCWKVRDQEGNWQLIESFVHDHSEARFSHGIRPDCALQLYREVFIEKGVSGSPTQK